MTAPAVAHTAEFQRVLSLPRRVWSDGELASLASSLTEILRTPANTPCIPKPCTDEERAKRVEFGLCPICEVPLHLRPVQALALYEAGTVGGLFGAIGVGEGKTLISFMLAVVMQAERTLLMQPANLIEKTQRERLALSCHWRIPNSIRLFSYEMLGLVDYETELENYSPDLIILEEGHKMKNKRAARTRRMARYMHARPQTKVCVLSGTVMDKSMKDFAHPLIWSLKLGAPVPTKAEEIEEWAEALDEIKGSSWNGFEGRRPGALLELCSPAELAAHPPHIAARHGFRRRLTETPGVVATIGEGEHVDCSIYVRGIIHKVAPVTEENFRILRGDARDREHYPGWQTPDRWDFDTAAEAWMYAQELALGLFYKWDPRPPLEWREARKAWHAFVRETISRGRTYDSELHVANACDAGHLDSTSLERWRRVRDAPGPDGKPFTPNVVPVWCDDSALKTCRDWMKTPGIVWTEHQFFARRLSEFAGVPYFGSGGFTDDGKYIEDARPGSSCIASIDANREGKNLQRLWHRSLYVCPHPSSLWMEQSIARIHRPGQTADEVIVDILLGCRENYDSIMSAIRGARAIEQTTGKKQKLLIADVTLPREDEIDAMRSPRWVR